MSSAVMYFTHICCPTVVRSDQGGCLLVTAVGGKNIGYVGKMPDKNKHVNNKIFIDFIHI